MQTAKAFARPGCSNHLKSVREIQMADSNSSPTYSSRTDLTGKRFGSWTVLHESEKRQSRRFWHCLCDCGKHAIIDGKELRLGRSTGCIRCRNRTHGQSAKCPEYKVWKKMRSRCENTANKDYHHYGGRGISVCDEWKSFEAFYRDMGPRPSPKHTIERMENSLGYSKANCVWATRKKQSRNTRRNRILTFDGITQSVPDWADQLGISQKILHFRLRAGWTVEDTLTIPANGRRPQCSHLLTFEGITLSVADWAKRLGISQETLHWRLSKKWSVERVLTTPPRKRH